MATQRTFWVTGTDQLSDLQRRLDAAGGPPLRANLNRRIRRAGEPVRDDLQRTLRTLPIWGKGQRRPRPRTNPRPLRRTMAAAVRLSVTTGGGTRIYMDRRRLPLDLWSMPRNTNEGHWRHPTFNNRHKRGWVDQYARAGWWWSTIRPHMPRIKTRVEAIRNDIERQLGG